ncbi:succinate dehydrogenase cytochrome b subunit [Mucilaginibacter myungsuensis]|uniref:Succinate dehydrogenase cytochrome b subunit n=1 Tax=Mucilaginibacter myungsuensis TaxID=649104 RepID=A0A929KVU4_9SPHI|nr:succinate dehydrogenase cytochrome b subunit [Mucilaginibacter myungsuensis]MBE9661652.1 succinate dehydrogenase cytochrome b subunit [Mucilaginibacter myungsuensis]MDN3597796.1 succinate dehydrogenase cytochrome b subunit [Mucilaginibacter myungsuensis]
MSQFKQTFNSSIGKKLIMALTGLFLCTFLIVHLAGNLQLFQNDEGYAFNVYANFLTHFPPIEVIAYILYAFIVIHALYALILTINNRKARPVQYAHQPKSPTSWGSKNMGLLGSILLLFIVIHMSDFWYKYKYTDTVGFKEYRTNVLSNERTVTDFVPESKEFEHSYTTENDVEVVRVKDLHKKVSESFSQWWYVLIYVIAQGALSFHLLHGFQSAFRTLGWTHRKYTPIVEQIGIWLFAVIIPLGFAAMPVVYFFMGK